MIPTTLIEARIADLIGADTVTLANAVAVELVLIKAAFTPAADLEVADLTLADFNGYAALPRGALPNQVFTDPNTGDQMVQVAEPAGGWHFETTGVTNLPQTIFGWGLTDGAGADLYGTDLFNPPIVLTGTGQGIDVDQVRYRMSSGGIV